MKRLPHQTIRASKSTIIMQNNINSSNIHRGLERGTVNFMVPKRCGSNKPRCSDKPLSGWEEKLDSWQVPID